MGRIHLLDDEVINKIAAGEVVERPASVVKELVENAIDAGATAITISLELGGTRSIVVADNGSGMSADDAVRALTRHATSKISAADDLFHIQTMGFRGEALASIAAVSRLTLATCEPRLADDGARTAGEGVKLTMATAATGGSAPAPVVTPYYGPVGTTIAVENLFYNMPVRAKFLKAPATEFSYCLELVQALALCHPGVGFTLTHNTREHFRVAALPDAGAAADTGPGRCLGEPVLRERALAVVGKDASELLYVMTSSRYGRVEALVSPPGVEKTSGKGLFTFVNGRWVKDKVVRYGVLRGYHSHLLKGRFPVAVVHLGMDPTLVDVNVHPAKTELRFQYPSELQSLLALAIRERLRTGDWAKAPVAPHATPSTEPNGRSDTALATAPSGRGVAEGQTPGEQGAAVAREPAPFEYGPARPFAPPLVGSARDRVVSPPRAAAAASDESTAQRASPVPAPSSWSSSSLPPSSPSSAPAALPRPAAARSPQPAGAVTSRREYFGAAPDQTAWSAAAVSDKAGIDALLGLAGTSGLSGAGGEDQDRSSASSGGDVPWDELVHVGVFDRCYLMFAVRDQLLVIDQHAFHERILYERLAADASLLAQSQRLLVPEAVELSPVACAHLMARREALLARGFDLQLEGATTVVVKAVPSLLAGRDLDAVLASLSVAPSDADAAEWGDGLGSSASNAELAHLILATAACHAAVRAGEELPANELKHLLSEAKTVDFYHNCPHGRRVLRWWSRAQVARWFDR